jgi:cohesin complex subunit SA-1/2
VQAFTLVLDGIVADETNVVQLAKHLAQTFMLRGAHLTVLKRLDVQYIVQIHTTSLSWIAKRIAGYETNGNKKALRTATTFFKVLVPLLVGIHSRDAMKMCVSFFFRFQWPWLTCCMQTKEKRTWTRS